MRWPGMEIVEGPLIAGLGPGDQVAVDVGRPILLYPRRYQQPFGFDIDVDEHIDVAIELLRRETDESRRRNDSPRIAVFGDDGWRVDDQPASAGPQIAGPWRVRLLDDVGAVPTVRRVGSMVLGRPMGVRTVYDALLTVWLLLSDPNHLVLRAADGSLTTLPRRVGAPLDQLRRAKLLGGHMDPERAKAIALAADGAPLPLFLGFHGAVFHAGVPTGERGGWSALEHFCRLIGTPLAWERDRPAAQAAFDRTELADVKAIADLARSIDPGGWEREQLLREECALVAC
ncbi:MAG: hypothetical protein Q8O67_32830 [Deltaproteobacteria bacterium]|nr:hypothetical protein [Deltaproteobacteria bacterium]